MTLKLIDETSFEQIKTEMVAAVQAEMPEYADVLSDPLMVNVHVAGYREWLLRRRLNALARATFPQHALEGDLEERAAMFGIERLESEEDEPLRNRVLAAPEMFTTAGSVGEYEERTREVSPTIKAVHVAKHTPVAGSVTVTVLAIDGNGTPDGALLAQIDAALNREEIRTLCDTIYIQGAAVQEFTVDATLTPYPNRDTTLIEQAARDAVQAYVDARHDLGHDVELSGLYASLHVAGVKKATLSAPAASIVRDPDQVAWCSSITLSFAAADT